MISDDRYQERRSDYDVTNRVKVSSQTAVRQAVADIFADLYPDSAFDPVWLAFLDFERFFSGLDPSYHGVDTAYHDIQHTLDLRDPLLGKRNRLRLLVDRVVALGLNRRAFFLSHVTDDNRPPAQAGNEAVHDVVLLGRLFRWTRDD